MKINPIFLSIAFMLFVGKLYAQDEVDQQRLKDEAAVERIVKDFAREYSDLGQSKDKKKVLQFFNTHMVSNMNFIRIGGRVNVSESNYEKLEDHLEGLLTSELLVSHKVDQVFHISIKGDIGVISYQNNFEVTKDGDVLSKGSQLVTITQRKFNDEWKIIVYNVTEIEDAKLKGNCLCELFESTDAGIDYVSKVIIPGGTSYKKQLENFQFRPFDGQTIIKTGDLYFAWMKGQSNDIFTYDLDKEEKGVKIGESADKKTVVLKILESIHAESCTKLVTR
ncbi:MAG: hypothetical protein AAF740_12590 [Bacteroidota bacterium]